MRSLIIVVWLALTIGAMAAGAQEAHRHEVGRACGLTASNAGDAALEGIQLETSDIGSFERLFETILGAATVFKIDHPQVDALRGYCYRDLLIVIRQDFKTPRPAGWVQVNFSVPDVMAVQRELETAANRSQQNREAVRLKLKPDVPRSNCKVSRLELYGPEGFLLGFDQVKPETCQ